MATAKDRHPEVYTMRTDDPRTRKRKVPMEVLSMGYSRTGTMSIRAALEILGIPTWHWVTMAENPADLEYWNEALQWKFGKAPPGTKPFGHEQFDGLLGDWGACTDQPAAVFTEELVKAYPEAKVLLVERDAQKWYGSFSKIVIDGAWNWTIPILEKVDPVYIRQMAISVDLLANNYFGVQGKRASRLLNQKAFFEEWRQRAVPTYLAHNEMVKRVTPADRLLIVRLEDGWEPICKFLGKEIPNVPFPKVNETAAIKEKIDLYLTEGYKRGAIRQVKRVVPVVMILAVAYVVLGHMW